MMPGLESVEEVKMLVDAVKYQPIGKRGMGISRASAYTAYSGTSAPEYIKFSNENTMVIIQFEDEKLLPNFPASDFGMLTSQRDVDFDVAVVFFGFGTDGF